MIYIWIAIAVVLVISILALAKENRYWTDSALVDRLRELEMTTNNLALSTSPRKFNVGDKLIASRWINETDFEENDNVVVLETYNYTKSGWEYRVFSTSYERYFTINESSLREIENK